MTNQTLITVTDLKLFMNEKTYSDFIDYLRKKLNSKNTIWIIAEAE
jgi:hypothetical protein